MTGLFTRIWDTLLESIGMVFLALGYLALKCADWAAAQWNDEEGDDDDDSLS